ncbi:hypothetical protein [Dyadobacter sp. CY343]|jgi:hypothetical protein|uniref:hypothetical protein n=1 Tax=Dyadobacter sp. CY343 TaxID=2907299 RepID=UPI001F2A33DC|nr:hypothetical protein [Dyadobacter sp. CY343]
MKTYLTVFRILSMILLVGLIAVLVLFRIQNWEISPVFYGVTGFLLMSVIIDSLRNR